MKKTQITQKTASAENAEKSQRTQKTYRHCEGEARGNLSRNWDCFAYARNDFFVFGMLLFFLFPPIASALDVTVSGNTSAAIQTAINSVHTAGGGTVYIPSGTFTISATINSLGGINIIGAGQGKTIFAGNNELFINDPYGPFGAQNSSQVINSSACRISGISFQNTGGNLTINSVRDFRIDHCDFNYPGTSMGGYLVDVGYRYTYAKPRGVIDHCKFNKCDYGVHFQPQLWDPPYVEPQVWNLPYSEPLPEAINISYAGTADTVYIEDCLFDGGGSHAVSSMNGAHYVVRHSTINGFNLDAHGPGYEHIWDWKGDRGGKDFQSQGGRCMEVYDNLFTDNGFPIFLRAGGGFAFHNILKDETSMLHIEFEGNNNNLQDDVYPSTGQPHNFWFWDNTLINTGGIELSAYDGVSLNANTFLQENRDYFLRAPSLAQDGFTYTPLPYPHYLVTGDTPPVTYILTTVVSPTGAGTVSGGGNYTAGISVQLTATPSSSYLFDRWTGSASGSSNPITVIMDTNKTMTARFVYIDEGPGCMLTVAVSPTGAGTVTLNPTGGIYAIGINVQLTATANSGYTFTSWSGSASGTANPVTVVMNSNKTVTANFSVSISTETIEEISEVKACPNPFIPTINANLKFKGTTAEDSEVRIYSVSGELVRAITKEGSDDISWDGKNYSGENVVSGMYVYIVNSPDNKSTGRIAVIR